MLSQEDLNTLRSQNYQLIFNIGVPYSGKKTQCEKIANEFKYSRISMKEIIQKEINSKTNLGIQIKQSLENKEPIKTDILTSILISSIIESPELSIMIEGFPNTLEEALFFEQNVIPITKIIIYDAKEEECFNRMEEDKNKKEEKMTKEEFSKVYSNILKNMDEINNFYSPFSIVHRVDVNGPIAQVNNELKKQLYPIIYSIIGKRYSGKTTLSQELNKRIGMKLINFNEFLEEKDIKERKNETEYVINNFILKLRKIQDLRVLIEDFPQNKEQYIYFINNCRPLETIYYLNAENSSCLERLKNIPLDDPNYTDCSKLDTMLYDFEQKKDFIQFLQKKSNFLEIDVNSHKILTITKMMKNIQPYIAYIQVENDISQENKDELFNKLKNKYNFYEIVISDLINNAKKRNILCDKPIEEISIEEKINLIKKILYQENHKKIILNTFPLTVEELNKFESSLCEISKYIVLTENQILSSIQDVNSMAVNFYKKNIVTTINPKDISNDYSVGECINLTRDINIIYGMPQTGKTSLAKYFKENFGFELLDFKELTEKVKKTKVDPENPEAEVEINFNDLVKGLKDYLNTTPLNKRIIIDNIFIQNSPDPFLIDTYEKALEIIKAIGNFRNLYLIDIDEKTLINRYKVKEGITEELTEDQKAAFNETLDKPKKLLEELKKISNNIINLKYGNNLENTFKLVKDEIGYNFIIIKHEYDISIEKTLKLFAARNKLLYVNVPRLLYEHFYENDDDAKKLEGFYGKKDLKIGCTNNDNIEEIIYYKYNPVHFEKNLVNQLILKYIANNYHNIEKTGNFILLSGYLNYDLLKNPEEPFNLPLLELKKSMELGELTAFVQMTRDDIKSTEDEKPEQIIIEKPKKKKKEPKEGEEGEGNEEGDQEKEGEGEQVDEENKEEEEPQEEENPDGKPKFKPENFSWTSYDGKPRNYVQVLKRLKAYPVKFIEASDTSREELIKVIGSHIDNYMARKDTGYDGMITIIKINGDVPEETDEAVNKVSRFIETRREAEILGNKGKFIKDKRKAGGVTELL